MLQKASYKKGDFIGQKYEVYDVLGMGGFGIVYLVYSHETKSAYALKTFRDEYLEDLTTRERFKKEAQVWIDLERHPYLVRAYFVDEISGRLFIAMEHIASDEEGLNTLDGFLRCRPPDLAQSLKWAIQFCYGMEYAYSRGIKAHRDIKPANILIGQDKAVKISDFGLAGVISASKTFSGIKGNPQHNISGDAYQTMEGTAFGTPPYMPPEQFINAAGCDERSDIYSFGVVLYQMASGGKLPFYPDVSGGRDSDVFQEWYMLHSKASIPKLNTPLFPIIFRCLEKNPINRYFSFKELRADIEPILKRETGEIIKVPELKEFDAWEWYNKGHSLNTLGKIQEAIACYDKALEIEPNYVSSWLNKGIILNECNRHSEAIICFDNAIRIDPLFPKAWYSKGNALYRLCKYQEAIVCYDKVLEIDSKFIEALYNKGLILSKLIKHHEALVCYDRILEINPRHTEAWFNKGMSLSKIDEYDESLRCIDITLQLNPRQTEAWFLKGCSFGDKGKYEEAIACYDRALEIDPKYFGAWYNKGFALLNLGMHQDTITCYNKVLEIEPQNAVAWHNKGESFKALGMYKEAIEAFKNFIRYVTPKHAAHVEKVKEIIKQLET